MHENVSARGRGSLCTAVAVAFIVGACASPDEVSMHAPVRLSEVTTADAADVRPDTLSRAAADDYRAGWASRLIGEPVIDGRGQHLGLLNDFVVHTSTGQVRYAIISDKRPASGERLVAVPVRLLWRTEDGTLFLETDRERFDEQRWWIAERWPGLQDILVWRETVAWGLPPPGPASARDDARRVSRLLGSYVNDAEGLPLGRIVDVVIDMNRQHVHYTVLRVQGPVNVPPNQAFAVPIDRLVFPDGHAGRVTLAVPQARVISLLGTDPDHGPPVNDLRYLGTIDRSFSVAFPRELSPADTGGIGATR